jgi:hypothetical protein
MKRICFILGVLMVLGLAGCAGETTKEVTETAVYEDFTLVLGDAEKFTDETGREMVRVHATYTNDSSDPYYALSCFAVRAFQNDKELTEYTDINGDEAALIREVKNGQSLEVAYVFGLEGGSEVEVLVGTPTADEQTIGRQVYFSTEG